jgi:hypothetical protein
LKLQANLKELDLTTKDKKKGKNVVKEESDGWLDEKNDQDAKEGEEPSINPIDQSVEGVDERAEKKRMKKEHKKRDKRRRRIKNVSRN